jgi:predicted nucleotidyltransferase
MNALQGASLSEGERALLVRFADELQEAIGRGLCSVWLFGSRARGEQRPANDSDVDVLVLVEDASWESKLRVHAVLEDVARDLDLEALVLSFSLHINTPTWLAQRRAIRSFFIAEVDRDKLAVLGST